MPAAVIELSDVAVGVYTPDGLVAESPGYALTAGEDLIVGAEAYASAHLHPRATNNRFWSDLSLEPMPRQGAAVFSHADLACAHMKHIWEQARDHAERVLFVVPGSFSRQQLGLLLGIAQECAMPVGGMIDAAVAASPQPFPGRSLMHLDAQLHQVVLTRLAQGTQLSRAAVETSVRSGLAELRDTWVREVAAVFMRTTRFDPLHDAATEQALYDALPGWLASLRSDGAVEARIESAQGKAHAVTLQVERMVQVVEGMYRHVLEMIQSASRPGEPLTLELTHRLAALPGLREILDELPDCELVVLDADAAARGAFAHESRLLERDGDSVAFVTHVPWRPDAQMLRPPSAPPPTDQERPTHLLYLSRAYPIDERPLVVGSELPAGARGVKISTQLRGVSRRHCSVWREDGAVAVEDHSSYGTFVNGERIEGRVQLRLGDRLRVGTPGHELQLIGVF